MALAFALLVIFVAEPAHAGAASSGSIILVTRGLPGGQRASIVASGPRFHRVITATHASLRGLPPGVYVFGFRPVVIEHQSGHVAAGATAYPAKGRLAVRVRAGKTARLVGIYSAIVNASVRPLPGPLLGVIGSASHPLAVALPGDTTRPAIGTIFTSGPTSMLPFGLISRVTDVARQGSWLLVSLAAIPIADATPELTFTGSLPLAPASNAAQEVGSTASASSAGAHAASSCSSPSLLHFRAHLDSVEVRRAFLGAWPPQLELTLAVRTTESLGVSAAAVGINCNWTVGEIGPYQEAIPVGPVVVPVYATLPVNVGLHVNGTLGLGTFNVASTTVANVAAGFDHNEASLSQQGSNVWVAGAPSLSGSAKLSASIGVQAGIGVAKGANVHLQADFGPELDWTSGHDCNLLVNMGSLSAGVSVFGRTLSTPSFTPWQLHLWHGCHANPTPGPGPTPTPTPTPTPSQPEPSTPPPSSTYSETTGGVAHTWTNYSNAGGYQGPSIASNDTVQIACKLTGFRVEDGNTWWYRIASSPWNNAYYVSADAFYNNGQTTGSLHSTPFVDPSVANC